MACSVSKISVAAFEMIFSTVSSRKRRHLFYETKYLIGKEPLKTILFLVSSFLLAGGFMKTCSFFGHRDTPQTEELKQKVRKTVERLIVEEGVDTFLFGSRSKFDELCHIVVTELKEKYPHIRRIAYLCKHEAVCLVGEGEETRRRIKIVTGRDVYVGEYEEIKKSHRVNSAGRAAYVERNYWIIDDSSYSIIFLHSEKQNSGTRVAYNYAKKAKVRVLLV